ncbi:hypothetical protein F442_17608 [Phytophthora nicotianae P10297]|uniref:Uncharacterized protein n=2 Tax=Phytophthora nicotianae TaxID=4792 RepID=W2YGM5_PHYNI|nr:hypothetical protein F444_17789 [Phytophthora nicotianae P1976]ETP33982.1 hypothetical protein F442_17608 [Phytophthora nicotianae P10297]
MWLSPPSLSSTRVSKKSRCKEMDLVTYIATPLMSR